MSGSNLFKGTGVAAAAMATVTYTSAGQWQQQPKVDTYKAEMNVKADILQIVDAKIGASFSKVETKIAVTDGKFDRIIDKLEALSTAVSGVSADVDIMKGKVGSKWWHLLVQAVAIVLGVMGVFGLMLASFQTGFGFKPAMAAAPVPAAQAPAEPPAAKP